MRRGAAAMSRRAARWAGRSRMPCIRRFGPDVPPGLMSGPVNGVEPAADLGLDTDHRALRGSAPAGSSGAGRRGAARESTTRLSVLRAGQGWRVIPCEPGIRARGGGKALTGRPRGRRNRRRRVCGHPNMTKPSVYIETSIVSYLTARPSRDLIVAAQQTMTREWWRDAPERFVLVASELMFTEAGAGDADAAPRSPDGAGDGHRLDTTQDAAALTRRLLELRAFPRRPPRMRRMSALPPRTGSTTC